MENVVVVGASANEERYSNKAMRMLAEYGHNPIPVAPAASEILGRQVFANVADVVGLVDTVTVYRAVAPDWFIRADHPAETQTRHFQSGY